MPNGRVFSIRRTKHTLKIEVSLGIQRFNWHTRFSLYIEIYCFFKSLRTNSFNFFKRYFWICLTLLVQDSFNTFVWKKKTHFLSINEEMVPVDVIDWQLPTRYNTDISLMQWQFFDETKTFFNVLIRIHYSYHTSKFKSDCYDILKCS